MKKSFSIVCVTERTEANDAYNAVVDNDLPLICPSVSRV